MEQMGAESALIKRNCSVVQKGFWQLLKQSLFFHAGFITALGCACVTCCYYNGEAGFLPPIFKAEKIQNSNIEHSFVTNVLPRKVYS